ncbi:hypothetical protein J4E91_003440 [Alternaria rosae]|nr:hypothetical protein J4E91_003440 [Alternaria rosae]
MMNPQSQSDMMDYSMCGGTQDPRPFQQVSERVKDTAKTPYCQNAEETIDDLFNKVMGAIHPEVLATIKAEGIHSDDFTMDNINIESWQTDISLSRSTAPASSSNCYSAMKNKIRIRKILVPSPWPLLLELASMRKHLKPQTQPKAPWMEEQSQPQGQTMQDISQQKIAGCQFMATQPAVPISEPMRDQPWRPKPAHPAIIQAPLSAFAKVPIQAPRAIATAAPQSMHFANFAEAQRAAATRVIHYNYLPLANDSSFPQDQAARTFYIRQLYDAFTDITQCIDSATVANFDLRWATLSSSTSPYTPAMITTICHALLSVAINLHTQGPISLNVFDKGKLENVYKFRDLTFGARVDKACELMRINKAR